MPKRETLESLKLLQGDSKRLSELDAFLSTFNVFEILQINHLENPHSNMLAWLLDSRASHNAGMLFFKKWVEAIQATKRQSTELVDQLLECLTIEDTSTRTRREWTGESGGSLKMDILVEIRRGDKTEATVCIENKVRSKQRLFQLADYRNLLESNYPNQQRYFIFLTKDLERPNDAAFVGTDYLPICQALGSVIDTGSLQGEARMILTQYQKAIKRYFMDDSEEKKLANEVYRKHYKAIDYIISVRPDCFLDLSNSVSRFLSESGAPRFTPIRTDRNIARFLPPSWVVKGNENSAADHGYNIFVQIEMNENAKARVAVFQQMHDDSKCKLLCEAVRSELNDRGIADVTPAEQTGTWYEHWGVNLEVGLDDLNPQNVEATAESIRQAVQSILKSDSATRMVEIIAGALSDCCPSSATI